MGRPPPHSLPAAGRDRQALRPQRRAPDANSIVVWRARVRAAATPSVTAKSSCGRIDVVAEGTDWRSRVNDFLVRKRVAPGACVAGILAASRFARRRQGRRVRGAARTDWAGHHGPPWRNGKKEGRAERGEARPALRRSGGNRRAARESSLPGGFHEAEISGAFDRSLTSPCGGIRACKTDWPEQGNEGRRHAWFASGNAASAGGGIHCARCARAVSGRKRGREGE